MNNWKTILISAVGILVLIAVAWWAYTMSGRSVDAPASNPDQSSEITSDVRGPSVVFSTTTREEIGLPNWPNDDKETFTIYRYDAPSGKTVRIYSQSKEGETANMLGGGYGLKLLDKIVVIQRSEGQGDNAVMDVRGKILQEDLSIAPELSVGVTNPDHSLIAYNPEQFNQIGIYDVKLGKNIQTLSPKSPIANSYLTPVAWTDDSRSLIVAPASQRDIGPGFFLFKLNISDGKITPFTGLNDLEMVNGDVTPDGMIAIATKFILGGMEWGSYKPPAQIVLTDLKTSTNKVLLASEDTVYVRAEIAPDGKSFSYLRPPERGDGYGRIYLASTARPTSAKLLSDKSSGVWAWSEDSRYLLFQEGVSTEQEEKVTIILYDTLTGSRKTVFTGANNTHSSVGIIGLFE